MKKIIFVRHGKAEELDSDFPDFERSLTNKGKIITKCMAARLRKKENSPGIFISSPAFRAVETALIFALEFGIDPEKIILNSYIYYKMGLRYLPKIISNVNDDTDTITLFGHNPSFTEIPNSLCNEGCDFMPKSGVIGISFDIQSWKEIRNKKGKLEYYLIPEKIK